MSDLKIDTLVIMAVALHGKSFYRSDIFQKYEIQAEDALNDAVSLDVEVKAEEQAAAADDAPVDATDEQQAAVEEVAQGLDKAEPGEGEAVADNPVA